MRPPPDPLAHALAPVRDVYRHLVDAATAWQAARPRKTAPDHWVLLCGAADPGSNRRTTPTRWTRTGAYHLLRCDVPNWCSVHRCHWPEEVPEAMWEWLDFLFDTGRFD